MMISVRLAAAASGRRMDGVKHLALLEDLGLEVRRLSLHVLNDLLLVHHLRGAACGELEKLDLARHATRDEREKVLIPRCEAWGLELVRLPEALVVVRILGSGLMLTTRLQEP